MGPGAAVQGCLPRLGKALRRFERGQAPAPRRANARSAAPMQSTSAKQHLETVSGGTTLPGSDQSAACAWCHRTASKPKPPTLALLAGPG